MTTGLVARITAPPRVADKVRWAPIHLTDNDIYWAVKGVEWKYPPERFQGHYERPVRPPKDRPLGPPPG